METLKQIAGVTLVVILVLGSLWLAIRLTSGEPERRDLNP